MCRWLVLVAEFDRREGWRGWGLRSCAQWLNWKCGLSMGAAHEHVRVAHRLSELPVVRRAFSVGQLSYSKARALTRMATPASEAELVDLARHATAAHLERLARARRAVRAGDEREEANRRHEARHVHWFFDDDGSLVLTARLDPEEGALVLQALDAAAHALRYPAQTSQSSAEDGERQPAPSCSGGHGAGEAADDSPESSRRRSAAPARQPADRADALVAMADPHPPGPAPARRRLSLPRLHPDPLRGRPPHRALGPRRAHVAGQPRAVVPVPPPGLARGRLRPGAHHHRWVRLHHAGGRRHSPC
ncbi:MAG TPA: DUF222 domain-containing protein, partial [Acidimicrobiales bacterium]|nr:DUF222 domain-containing protein [Acidimicrobiales bacterium]